MRLLDTLRDDLKLTPEQMKRLRRIQQEDLSDVARKAMEELELRGMPTDDDYIAEGLLAWQQYCAVAILDPWNMHAVSPAIDPFWHAHVLHTRAYTRFCEETCGQYLHHDPLKPAIEEDVDIVEELYAYTYMVYGRLFSYVNPTFYPEVMPREELVCTHANIGDPELRADTSFEDIPQREPAFA